MAGRRDNKWEIPGLKTAVHIAVPSTIRTIATRAGPSRLPCRGKCSPSSARPAPPHEGEQWRIDFSRVEWQHRNCGWQIRKVPKTPEDNWVWSPQGVINMHRPEQWGYVQFTKKTPGAVTFRPDPAAPARDALQEVYYAQKEFFKKHTRWAGNFDELGLAVAARSPVARPVLRLTRRGV